ncbi:MAG: hypothetical protein ACLGHP_11960, partial [Vicinamibacteria bacterium]
MRRFSTTVSQGSTAGCWKTTPRCRRARAGCRVASTPQTSTVPLVVQWGPSGQTYELQERVNDSSYTAVTTGSTVKVTR